MSPSSSICPVVYLTELVILLPEASHFIQGFVKPDCIFDVADIIGAEWHERVVWPLPGLTQVRIEKHAVVLVGSIAFYP